MSLEQRTKDYFDSGGGTALPKGISLPEETEYPAGSVHSFGMPRVSKLTRQGSRIFIVTSGTSADVGSIAEDYTSNMQETGAMALIDAYVSRGASGSAFSGARAYFKSRVKGYGPKVPEFVYITEADIDHLPDLVFSCKSDLYPDFVAAVTFSSGGTALVERRNRDAAAAVAERAQQREKNKPAIALLETWLAEKVDATSEAASLKETIEALNAERAHSRKLFP